MFNVGQYTRHSRYFVISSKIGFGQDFLIGYRFIFQVLERCYSVLVTSIGTMIVAIQNLEDQIQARPGFCVNPFIKKMGTSKGTTLEVTQNIDV